MNQEELNIQTLKNQIINQPPPMAANTIFTECYQCGLIHPPLKEGEICPNAPISIEGENGTKKIIKVDNFLVSLKNIIISQVSQKNIKDPEKLLKHVTIELTRIIETYEE